ncbi:C39 family peptidase [Enterococcus sp. AZ103]|uniref:C39 family peptidase n=1 Tax=Enterococcus sp. AZ103 TaxID=2774628 RepID=UPI003F23A175
MKKIFWSCFALTAFIGIAVFAQENQAATLYRLYNTNSSEHFYTIHNEEKTNLMRSGWRYEGTGWQTTDTGQSVYRLYNENAGDHHYTLSETEKNDLISKGWKDEGISWYTPESGINVYRLYNKNAKAGAHHYTTSVTERDNLIHAGWQNEGVSWKATGEGTTVSDSASLNAPYINQNSAGYPMGCEAAALLQALQTKGQANNYNLRSFIDEMPLAANGNPNDGFGGRPDQILNGTYQSIYPKPLAAWGSRYGNVENISDYSPEELKEELRGGNPVVVFVTLDFAAPRYGNYWWGTGINNAHVMTLDGFDNHTNRYHVSDPNAGQYWVEGHAFEASYNLTRYAVVVR